MRASAPETLVLILSDHTEPSWVQAAFAAGACGYLTKSSSTTEIEDAVREVLQGRFYVSPVVAEAAVQPALLRRKSAPPAATAAPAAVDPLTPRETDIAHLVGQGLGNQEIACTLGLSVTTIRSHLTNVYRKLGSMSRVALALLFVPKRREARASTTMVSSRSTPGTARVTPAGGRLTLGSGSPTPVSAWLTPVRAGTTADEKARERKKGAWPVATPPLETVNARIT